MKNFKIMYLLAIVTMISENIVQAMQRPLPPVPTLRPVLRHRDPYAGVALPPLPGAPKGVMPTTKVTTPLAQTKRVTLNRIINETAIPQEVTIYNAQRDERTKLSIEPYAIAEFGDYIDLNERIEVSNARYERPARFLFHRAFDQYYLKYTPPFKGDAFDYDYPETSQIDLIIRPDDVVIK